MKLLGESDGLQAIAPQHRDSPTRLPIKVDLRDFATWLRKEDPFTPGGESLTPPRWKKSLEAFLAALISTYSGGTIFGSDDFIALVRISAVLLVLDGLDEVADIPRRREVVDEIVSGIQRLKANAASLQTIVTSRPAAFANSPGIPALTFPCLQLLSLSRSSIDQYAERWMRARRLDSKEASDFKKVLKAKLDQPHLRDLARNPMQLAILLSLVLRRGDLST